MDLSIIIVSYNTQDLLRQTIQSVIDTTHKIKYEIIVSDNDSSDGSPLMVEQEFKEVKLIKTGANLGFSKGNNIGIKEAKGRYILLLNSDTVVKGNCLDECVRYMDQHNEIGVLGCKIVLPSGKLDHACKRGFPTPQASLYYMLGLYKAYPNNPKYGAYCAAHLGEDEVGEADALMGAFMMLPRAVIDEVGGLDEAFFMYGEDLDWCYRIKEAGYKVMYYPKEYIVHHKGSSSKKKRIKTIYEFHRAMILFYNKHYRKKHNLIVTLGVYFGVVARMIMTYIVNLWRK
ncbi:MAG TPA: glycosyltransferase family 2 protein [Epulopiscium sp.]|nr:glycosyltransferase family 2 protein [Candidatus Epulonipiscium sp.]